MMHGIYEIIFAICWGGLGLFWLAGWIYNLRKAKAVQKRSTFLPAWLLCIALVWTATLLLRRNDFLAFLTFTAPWLQILGTVLLIGATIFTFWARWVLGTMWAAFAEIKEQHELRTAGPYHITRHPIYTGLIAMMLGSTFINGFGIAVLYSGVGLIAIIIKIRSEERLLKETFGAQYTQYQQHVPQLVPGQQLLRR